MNPIAGFWDRIPFTGRLLVTASLALLIAGSAMLYSSARRDADQAAQDLRERLAVELNTLPPSLAELLVIGDFASLQQALDRLVQRPQIARLVYRDESGAVLSSRDQDTVPLAPAWFSDWLGLGHFAGATDAVIGGRKYGNLEITLTAQPAINRAWSQLVEHLTILALAILIDFIGIWLVLRFGLRPLHALDAATRALQAGDFSARVVPHGGPELRRSIDAFNHMAAAIAEARAALVTEKERLQVTLASIGDAVMTIDPDGRIEYLNPVAEQLTGWRTEEARGRPMLEVFNIISEETGERAVNPVDRVFAEGVVVGLANHTLLIARDGTARPIADSAAPIQAGSGILGAVLVFRDQTQERQHIDQLRTNESKLNTILDNVESFIYIKDTEHRYQYANRQVRQLFGRQMDDIVGRTDEDFFDTATADRLHVNDRRVLRDGERVAAEETNVNRTTGDTATYLSVKIPLYGEDGQVYGLCGVSTDITARKRAEDQLRLSASVFEHAQEGIIITDAEARILDVNPAFTTVTGYSREDALGRNPSFLKSGHHHPDFYADMWATLLRTGTWRGEIWNRRKDGGLFAELLTLTAVPAAGGGPGYFLGVFTDITQIKSHQQHLEHIAHYDALTQLPNRILLADRLHIGLAQARRTGDLMAVCYLDLDGFKPVNDTYGHEAGDKILVEVASRLTLGIRAGDTVARLGGDEFVLLLSGIQDVQECQLALDRLLRLLGKPYAIGDAEIRLSASIGVALFPLDETDPDTLLRHADQSMYAAKESGRNRYHLFDPEHDRRARAQREAIGRVQAGLTNGEFRLYYQPKVDMRRGKVIGAEALIRWQHPERGLLPPSEFLSFIEDPELAPITGMWVLDTALAQMAEWRIAGLNLPVSVNISGHHLQRPDFVQHLAEALARQPSVPPGNLELEILETSALSDLLHVTNLIEECRRLGVRFALDDFGTGYSSLSYFKRLPAETLKIDQSFVRDMLRESEDMAIVDGIIGLAEAFGRQVIAEGVEQIEHGLLLLHLGCDLAQGYAIARPMPAAEIPAWHARWRPFERWRQAAAARLDKADLPIVLAEFEHREWVDRMAHWLAAPDGSPPPLAVHACRFGRWHDGPGIERYGDLEAFRAITPLHDRVHALGHELAAMKQAGHTDQALSRLPELHALREDLLGQLARLRDHLYAPAA